MELQWGYCRDTSPPQELQEGLRLRHELFLLQLLGNMANTLQLYKVPHVLPTEWRKLSWPQKTHQSQMPFRLMSLACILWNNTSKGLALATSERATIKASHICPHTWLQECTCGNFLARQLAECSRNLSAYHVFPGVWAAHLYSAWIAHHSASCVTASLPCRRMTVSLEKAWRRKFWQCILEFICSTWCPRTSAQVQYIGW